MQSLSWGEITSSCCTASVISSTVIFGVMELIPSQWKTAQVIYSIVPTYYQEYTVSRITFSTVSLQHTIKIILQ